MEIGLLQVPHFVLFLKEMKLKHLADFSAGKHMCMLIK